MKVMTVEPVAPMSASTTPKSSRAMAMPKEPKRKSPVAMEKRNCSLLLLLLQEEKKKWVGAELGLVSSEGWGEGAVSTSASPAAAPQRERMELRAGLHCVRTLNVH
jgi:hypothetical protein